MHGGSHTHFVASRIVATACSLHTAYSLSLSLSLSLVPAWGCLLQAGGTAEQALTSSYSQEALHPVCIMLCTYRLLRVDNGSQARCGRSRGTAGLQHPADSNGPVSEPLHREVPLESLCRGCQENEKGGRGGESLTDVSAERERERAVREMEFWDSPVLIFQSGCSSPVICRMTYPGGKRSPHALLFRKSSG